MDDFETRRLFRDLELLNHLALLELGLVIEPEVAHPAFVATTCAKSPWKTAWLLPWRVVEAGPVVEALARHLDLERPVSLRRATESAVLRQGIGAEISQPMARSVSRDIGVGEEDARRRIVQLSRDLGLLPPRVVEAVGSFIPWAHCHSMERLAPLVGDPGYVDRIRQENLAITMHFDRVRKNGRNAKRSLIDSHRPLVHRIAGKCAGRSVAYSELVDAGNRGLASAVAEFDQRRGTRFKDYAAWWIQNAVSNPVSGAETAPRVSVRELQLINELMRNHRRLLGEKGREPTAEEMAQAMGITVAELHEIQSLLFEISGPSGLGRLQDIARMDMAFDACC